jgi:hypothetical protein
MTGSRAVKPGVPAPSVQALLVSIWLLLCLASGRGLVCLAVFGVLGWIYLGCHVVWLGSLRVWGFLFALAVFGVLVWILLGVSCGWIGSIHGLVVPGCTVLAGL